VTKKLEAINAKLNTQREKDVEADKIHSEDVKSLKRRIATETQTKVVETGKRDKLQDENHHLQEQLAATSHVDPASAYAAATVSDHDAPKGKPTHEKEQSHAKQTSNKSQSESGSSSTNKTKHTESGTTEKRKPTDRSATSKTEPKGPVPPRAVESAAPEKKLPTDNKSNAAEVKVQATVATSLDLIAAAAASPSVTAQAAKSITAVATKAKPKKTTTQTAKPQGEKTKPNQPTNGFSLEHRVTWGVVLLALLAIASLLQMTLAYSASIKKVMQ